MLSLHSSGISHSPPLCCIVSSRTSMCYPILFQTSTDMSCGPTAYPFFILFMFSPASSLLIGLMLPTSTQVHFLSVIQAISLSPCILSLSLSHYLSLSLSVSLFVCVSRSHILHSSIPRSIPSIFLSIRSPRLSNSSYCLVFGPLCYLFFRLSSALLIICVYFLHTSAYPTSSSPVSSSLCFPALTRPTTKLSCLLPLFWIDDTTSDFLMCPSLLVVVAQ